MARARLIKPGFFSNEDLCDLPAFARLLFAGLWTIADKKGRLDDRPKRIKAELFPYDNVKVPALLDALESKGFIQRYRIEDAHFIQIVNWDKHQHPHIKEPESVVPGPEWEVPSTVPALVLTSATTGNSGSDPSNTEADTDTDTKAEANTETVVRVSARPVFIPLPVEERNFSAQYVWHREQMVGKHPGGAAVAEASQLEREYGLEACLLCAEDLGWEKPPGYMRPILEKRRKNGESSADGRGESAAPKDTGGVADRVPGLDRRRAAIAERRRNSEQAEAGLRPVGT